LRITVNDNEVFKGTTQISLGYCTIHCQPARGKKVRIALTNLSNDAQTNIGTEVSGKKLDDGVARDDSKARGTLSIIEAEIYGQ
jgi:beta-galactosidase